MESGLWGQCVRVLEEELPQHHFNTWVRPLQAVEGSGALKLLAPNRFVVDWVNANLLGRIGELLRNHSPGDAPIVTVEVGSRPVAPVNGAAEVAARAVSAVAPGIPEGLPGAPASGTRPQSSSVHRARA